LLAYTGQGKSKPDDSKPFPESAGLDGENRMDCHSAHAPDSIYRAGQMA